MDVNHQVGNSVVPGAEHCWGTVMLWCGTMLGAGPRSSLEDVSASWWIGSSWRQTRADLAAALWAKEISAKIPWGNHWSVGGNGPPKVSGPASLSKHGCHLHTVRLAVPWSSRVSKVRGWDLQSSRVSYRNSVRSGTSHLLLLPALASCRWGARLFTRPRGSRALGSRVETMLKHHTGQV